MWSQHTKVVGQIGDLNTTIFHKTSSMRNKKNAILRLESQGKIIEDEEHIGLIIHDHFKNIFGPKADHRCHGHITDHQNQLRGWAYPDLQNQLRGWAYIRPPESIEGMGISQTSRSKQHYGGLGVDKTPGIDGFSIFFFVTFGTLLKHEVIRLLGCLHEGTLHLERLNYVHVVLIPKKGEQGRRETSGPAACWMFQWRLSQRCWQTDLRMCYEIV